MSKSYKEVIDETVEYYQNNDRAIRISEDGNQSGCQYFNPVNGNMCAAGRCFNNPQEVQESSAGNSWISGVLTKFGDEVFKEEYQGKEERFWESLQNLHDYYNNWNGRQLTDCGIKYVQQLHEIWDNKN